MGLRERLATPHIFISYRRSDAGGFAGQLLTALTDRYGDKAVTLDHASISAGDDFAIALDRALNATDVLLALIGPDWLTVEQDGERRLLQDGDWVRREIATALQRDDVRVIPVLVGGAGVPDAAALPADLAPLAARQMREVRPDRFDDDIGHLIDSIGGWRSRWRGVPIYAWLTAAALAMALLVSAFALSPGDDNAPPTIDVTERIDVVAGDEVVIDLLAWARDDGDGELTVNPDLRSTADAPIESAGDGTVRYQAPLGFSGSDSFTFRVVDAGGLETEATVFVDVRPGPMQGAFNVVVPAFTASGDATAAELGRTMSARTFERTEAAIAAVTDVRVDAAGPEIVGPIAGDTTEARAESAARLADQLNANLVIYGDVRSDQDVAAVALHMYVAERGLTGATELAGSYELGTLEQLTSNPAAFELALADFLDPRVQAIGELFIGLAHYQLNDYGFAETRFLAAEAAWPSRGAGNGKETVLHLLGNVAGLLDRDEEAAARYAAALEIAPDYARAQSGLAEVRFQLSRGPKCGGDQPEDVAGLDAAASDFAAIATAPAPPLSFLSERATVEIARIELCLTLYGDDRAEEARQRLEQVIATGADNPRLRNLVAEAHSSQATYHLIRQAPEAAIDAYGSAIESTLDDNRRASYHAAIGDIYLCILGEPELAAAEYAAGDALLDQPRPQTVCPEQ